jgi:hypothetical protein
MTTDEIKIIEPVWTCQICGRPIKAKNNIIAHHGYKRPDRGSGWQTASCAGARFQPYEISCDRLPPTIQYIKVHIARVESRLEEHINNPPKILMVNKGFSWNKNLVEVSLPESFDPKNPPCCVGMFSYEGEHSDIKRKYQKDIKYSKIDLEFLEKRLANWVPPKN